MEENPRTAVFLLIFSSSPAGTGQQCPRRAQGVCEAGSKGSPQHWDSFRLKLGETGTTTKTTQQILGSQSLQPRAHRVHPKWGSKSHGDPKAMGTQPGQRSPRLRMIPPRCSPPQRGHSGLGWVLPPLTPHSTHSEQHLSSLPHPHHKKSCLARFGIKCTFLFFNGT